MNTNKVSITFSIYNKKHEVLKNTICSISRQKTTFPFEIIIIDDGSQLHYEKFFQEMYLPSQAELKYKKIERVGFPFAKSKAIDMMDPNSKIVVMQSCDIMYGNDYTLQALVDGVGPNSYSLARVRNVEVRKKNFCDRYEKNMRKAMKKWQKVKNRQDIYCDPDRPKALLFFLGAMSKNNLINKTTWVKNSCDAVIGEQLRKLRDRRQLIPKWIEGAFGIHQPHEKIWYDCPIQDTCKYKCKRTKHKR